jgi:hypothetical protein
VENDLIRKSDVLKLIEDIKCNRDVPKNYGTLLDIMQMIRSLPTAYDVDKVVQELEERIEQTFCESLSRNGNNRDAGIRNNAYHNALEIVRNGGRM